MAAPFDPSAAANPDSGLFGLDTPLAEAGVHVLGVPFDATTSYGKGAADGPAAVLRASHQVDVYDVVTGRPYEAGIHMPALDPRVVEWNAEARDASQARVNELCVRLDEWVYGETAAALERGQFAVLLGGDHATAFGSLRAHAERHPGMGVLHVDAHADLRVAYDGYTRSHASVMHNALAELDGIAKVVQVGVRDLCEEEHDAIRASEKRVETLFDDDWAAMVLGGGSRADVRGWIARLPREVYVTFDVDGLEPALCPGTGTPVPGGLTWHHAMLWLRELAASGRRIVGCDLVEVAPSRGSGQSGSTDSIDAVVGARLLYRLIGFALQTRPDPRK
jgi:agmatinase